MIRSEGQLPSTASATQHSVAGLYAEALLAETADDDQAEAVAAELEGLVGLFEQIDGFEGLLTTALLSVPQRRALVRRVFHGRVGERVEALLAVLAKRNRLGLLRAVACEFRRVLEEQRGKVKVTVTTAVELTAEQRRGLADDLRRAFGAEPILTTGVDESLLGGATVQVGDRLYDASVATELKHLARDLAERIADQTG